MPATKDLIGDFACQARRILDLPIAHRVNRLGGYGGGGEVIYEAHPAGCPSVLVDSQGAATATFMSNGSVAFDVKLAEGLDIAVLDGSFDATDKRESRVPSQNVWLAIEWEKGRHVASLINPAVNVRCPAQAVRIVKLGDPSRAMWYCAKFAPAPGVAFRSAVKFSLVVTPHGPALLRQMFVLNTGKKLLRGHCFSYFNLHGTQRFVYNKDLWYDSGLPVYPDETVVAATVPYSSIVQVKRVSALTSNLTPVEATCDYSTFVGDTAATAFLPQAVLAGKMLPGGAGEKMNRFSTPTIAANQYRLRLLPGTAAVLAQSVLYVTDPAALGSFRETSASPTPTYRDIARSFRAAARQIVRGTSGVKECFSFSPSPFGRGSKGEGASSPLSIKGEGAGVRGSDAPCIPATAFELQLPAQPAIADYANSVWTGVKELYENCRAHGAKLANGIELGTRDRAQDMWPKMKEDPGRVRADLVHAMGFMYVTCDTPPATDHRLTLREKLHGMFPRQYPSRWDDRSQEIRNDNRPYNDSALWLLNTLNMYVRETGDVSILPERVTTVRLTDADRPETSGLLGAEPTQTLIEAAMQVLECMHRHAADSPYGLAQILYGDWCDPVDMYGTAVVGDAKTRGAGRGVGVRLSAHLFVTLVETIDLLDTPAVAAVAGIEPNLIIRLKEFATTLRANAIRFAWEDGPDAGFISAIHELNADGSVPDYAAGRIGYTLGSMRGRDFDGIGRRDLTAQAYGLAMLTTRRDWLPCATGPGNAGKGTPASAAGNTGGSRRAGTSGTQSNADAMVAAILDTVNRRFFDPKLGLLLYTTPIANNEQARALVGRMGVLPAGCAENGEYHHAQVFMHAFRLAVPGQADSVWRQFKPMMSVSRDESLAGPFETPSTSYACDRNDPHFGKGMYFGLSGSVDWIVQVFHRIVGLELNLHDECRPAVTITPNLPAELNGALTFRRIIHVALPGGGYRSVPLSVEIARTGKGRKPTGQTITINGVVGDRAEVQTLANLDRVDVRIVREY